LEHGADPTLGDNRGRNALALATERGHENIRKLLQSTIAAAQNRIPENPLKKFVRWWKAEDK
jgi:hypothetical protein